VESKEFDVAEHFAGKKGTGTKKEKTESILFTKRKESNPGKGERKGERLG